MCSPNHELLPNTSNPPSQGPTRVPTHGGHLMSFPLTDRTRHPGDFGQQRGLDSPPPRGRLRVASGTPEERDRSDPGGRRGSDGADGRRGSDGAGGLGAASARRSMHAEESGEDASRSSADTGAASLLSSRGAFSASRALCGGSCREVTTCATGSESNPVRRWLSCRGGRRSLTGACCPIDGLGITEEDADVVRRMS